MTVDTAQLDPPGAGMHASAIMAARPNSLEAEAPFGEAKAGASAAPTTFAQLVNRMMESTRKTPEEYDAQVRRHVEELLATTLVSPILKSLNEDPLESGLFRKSHGEKALRPLLEAEIAKDIVHNMRTGLVDQVARRLLKAGRASVQTSGQRLDVTERRSSHA